MMKSDDPSIDVAIALKMANKRTLKALAEGGLAQEAAIVEIASAAGERILKRFDVTPKQWIPGHR